LPQMTKILGVSLATAKNWTNGRTGLTIEPSIRKASGTGMSNLYSIEDLYLMAIARELSKIGFAAKAIGELLNAARPKVAKAQGPGAVWIITRARAAGPFRIEPERADLSGGTLSLRLEVGSLLRSVDESL